jgi:Xaa-Pro aminopeptidase
MFFDRLKNLQKSLQHPVLIKKKENLLYLTGCSFMSGHLLIKPSPRPSPRGRGGLFREASSSFRISDEALREVGLKRGLGGVVFLGDGLERINGIKSDFLKNVGKYVGKKEVLEVFGDFTYAEVKYIKSKNPELGIKVSVKRDPVDYLRAIKEPDEIAMVKKSMQIVERVFYQVKKNLSRSAGHRPAWTEIELAKFIQSAGLKMGAEDVSFPAIVASGANAAVPHHVPSNKRLRPGESIIIDFGFKYKNYCSDFTRTVFLKGVPKKLEMAYNQVEKAYNGAINFINSPPPSLWEKRGGYVQGTLRGASPSFSKRGLGGVNAGDVYQKSVSVLAEKRLDKYFIHSLGHGTGLEIHELPNLSPNSKDVLKDGMVFSIEPGVYIKGLGGVRIEDLVYLRRDTVSKFINVSTNLKNNII